jgi:hypothetical protein
VAVAVVVCGVLSAPLLYWPLGLEMAPDRRWMPRPPSWALVVGVAVGCAVVCLGGGAFLAVRRRLWGVGLILGWVGLAVVSSGWLTGLAGDLYEPERRYRPYVDRFTSLGRDEAERRAVAELRGLARGKAERVVTRGGCWEYGGWRRGLVEPLGSGTVEYRASFASKRPYLDVDRIARELARRYQGIGRDHEAAFETAEGFVVRLVPVDESVRASVRTPCLRRL